MYLLQVQLGAQRRLRNIQKCDQGRRVMGSLCRQQDAVCGDLIARSDIERPIKNVRPKEAP